jgi:hypothetical protein
MAQMLAMLAKQVGQQRVVVKLDIDRFGWMGRRLVGRVWHETGLP